MWVLVMRNEAWRPINANGLRVEVGPTLTDVLGEMILTLGDEYSEEDNEYALRILAAARHERWSELEMEINEWVGDVEWTLYHPDRGYVHDLSRAEEGVPL